MTVSEDHIEGLRKNSQFYFCSFPFVFDTYNNCPHGCRYCFTYVNRLVNASTKKTGGKDFFKKEYIKTVDVDKILSVLRGEEPTTKSSKEMKKLIDNRMPIHWGGMTDPFPRGIEEELGISLKILKEASKTDYPILLSTKGGWVVDNPEYMEAIRSNKNLVLQVSMICSNQEKVAKLEPGTPVDERLRLIEKVSKTNRVVVRMQPYIPLFMDDTWEQTVEDVAKLGAHALTTEWLKLSTFIYSEGATEARRQLNDAIGFDICNYFKRYGRKTSTDYEMPVSKKLSLAKKIGKKVREMGMEYYCADNELRHLGDGSACCGVCTTKHFSGYASRLKAQTSTALWIAKEKGLVYFNDVYGEDKMSEVDKAFLIGGKPSDFLNSGSASKYARIKDQSWLDIATDNWDNPRSPNNPAKMYIALVPHGLDEEGHIIYKYREV